MGSNDLTFDVNGDGAVTADDATFLVESILVVCEGDANLDGVVDARDLNAVGLNWLSAGNVGWATGDFNGDGTVDATDLNKIGVNWLKGAAPVRAARAPRAPLAFAVSPETVDRALDLSVRRVVAGSTPLDAPVEDVLARRSRPMRDLAGRRSLDRSSEANAEESNREFDGLDDIFAELS